MDLADTHRLALPWARRLARRLTAGGAPPSVRAQVVLLVSAFLVGCVAAGLLFVGIWRQTAAEGERVRTAQLADHQALVAVRRQLAGVQALLEAERASLAKSRQRSSALATALARTSAAAGHAADALTPRLDSIATASASLSHDAARLQSELAALQAYVANPGATGVDAGYLTLQTTYLSKATAGAGSRATTLVREAQQAQAAATMLRQAIRK